MANSDEGSEGEPVFIRKVTGFWGLYADSGIPPAVAPRNKSNVKFKTAVEQFDDLDLADIREYDRAQHGGINVS